MKKSILNKVSTVANFSTELSNSKKLQVVKASANLELMRLNRALQVYCTEAQKYLSVENYSLITFSNVVKVIKETEELKGLEFFSISDIEKIVKGIFKAFNVQLRENNKAEKLAAKLAKQAAKVAKI
jgi:hypothetical protein